MAYKQNNPVNKVTRVVGLEMSVLQHFEHDIIGELSYLLAVLFEVAKQSSDSNNHEASSSNVIY